MQEATQETGLPEGADFALTEDGELLLGSLFDDEPATPARKPKQQPIQDEQDEEVEPESGETGRESDEAEADEELDGEGEDEGDEDDGESEDETPPAKPRAELGEDGKLYVQTVGQDGKPTRVELSELLGDTRLKLHAAGQDVEVSFAELQQGYQRQADYTRKTQELAQERDRMLPYGAIVARLQADPQFIQHVQRFFQFGPDADAQQVSDEQIERLLDEDPEQAKRLIEYRRYTQQRQQIAQQVQAQQVQDYNRWAMQQREIAQRVIPEFEKAAPVVREYLKGIGFSEQEIATLHDARMAQVAHAAALYARGQQAKPNPKPEDVAAKRKPAQPPKVIKSSSGNQPSPQKGSSTRASRNSFQAAKKAGSTEAWANYLMQSVLGDED